MKKQLSYMVLVSMLFGATVQVHADDWKRNLLSAVGIGAAVGAAITAANWLFSESDEQLVIRAANTYRQMSNKYRIILDVYASISHYGYNEDGLYQVACVIWDTSSRQYAYRSQLSSSKNTLQKLQTTLRKRINTLSYIQEHDARVLVRQMQESLYYIEQLLPRIESLSRYLNTHRHYFDLYEADGRIRNKHQSMIDEVEAYRYDQYQVMAILRRYAVRTSGGHYPLTTFAAKLEKDITMLKSALRKADARYYNRIVCAQQLIDVLSHLLATLCSDPEYTREYYNREQLALQHQQARLERERLRNEQQRLAIERQRIREHNRHTCADQICDHTAADVQVSFNVTL